MSPHPLLSSPRTAYNIQHINTLDIAIAPDGHEWFSPVFEASYHVGDPGVSRTEVPPMGTDRALEGSASPADQGKSGLRILVVEDQADTAASLALLLRREGHEIQVAPDGLAAVGAVQFAHPDVVLLDIGLPGMSGWEVARWVTEQPAEKRPLLVAITGYGREEDRRRSEEAGIDLHLVKPVDPDQLLRLLRRFYRVVGG
jgi:CheY-like chemotaxis protein